MYPTPLPGPPQDQAHFLGVLAKLDDRICALIGQGHHLGDGYDHAYQADAAVCLALVNAGATDAEIRAIYVSHHQGIGRALLERGERYLWRTIAWAREIANDYQEVVAQMVWNNGEHVTVILGGAQGDREGLVVKQKLWPEREGWRWPFVHAGLPVPDIDDASAVFALKGQRLRVRLEEHDGGKLRVGSWASLLAPDQEATLQPPGTWAGWGDDEINDVPFTKMAARGVRVDLLRWLPAKANYRESLCADRARGCPKAADRLEALDSYEGRVTEAAKADPPGRVRAAWYPSWTTRAVAAKPALQQIAKGVGLRAAVVPAPGNVFVVGDFEHSQLRIAAGLSGDQRLLQAFIDKEDLHLLTGRFARPGMPDDQARQLGKTLNFAMLNGAGVGKVLQILLNAGLPADRGLAEKVVTTFRDTFQSFAAWREGHEGCASFKTPMGTKVNVPEGRRAAHRVTAAMLQAVEADALRLVLGQSDDVMRHTDAVPVLVIHDEILWECPKDHGEEVARRARILMEHALEMVCKPCPAVVYVEVRAAWGA
jgi:hypothetical protein